VFISFLYPFNIRDVEAPFLWIYYKQMTEMSPDDVVFVGSKEYFFDPAYFAERNRYELTENSAAYNAYLIPSLNKIQSYENISISQDIFFEILKKHNNISNLAWADLLMKEYEPLTQELKRVLESLIKDHDDIEGIISWVNCPSLVTAAKSFNIPIIFNEIGPFRPSLYRYMAYFDFSGVNGNTECEKRYKEFKKEITLCNENIQIFNSKELLKILQCKYEDCSNVIPTFKAGIALQVEDDSNTLAFSNGFNSKTLINLVKNTYDNKSILIREHPSGHLHYADEGCTIDSSKSSFDFISKCNEIFTINSSVGLETLLLGKTVHILGDSPFKFIEKLETKDFLIALSFVVVGYLIPYSLLFSKDYYRWRLKQHTESEIYAFNRAYLNNLVDIKNLNESSVLTLIKLENEQLMKDNDRLIDANKNLESSKEKLLQEYNNKSSELEKTSAELQKLQCELLDTKQSFAEAKQLLTETRQSLVETRQLLAETKQSLAETKSSLAETKQSLTEAQGIIDLMSNSHSWKMTQPLRLAKKIAFDTPIKETLLPTGTRRRKIAIIGKSMLKTPQTVLMAASSSNIKKFLHVASKNGLSVALSKTMDRLYTQRTVFKTENIIKPQTSISKFEKLTVPTADNFIDVSIVIPVYNQFEYTYNCIKSILENSESKVSFEIIIADDCSTDLTKDAAKVINNIKIIRNKINLRFLKNCNNAAKYAKGRFILFLNNDTEVQKNWLEPLVSLMDKNENVGLVGSKLVYADGTLQEAGGIVWKDASAWNYGHCDDQTKPDYNYVKDVDYISGASIMIRKTLWDKIGGFDERFAPAYYEDADLAFEVRRQGYRVVYQPLSVVIHFEGKSNGTDLQSGQKSYQIVNQKRFYEKWNKVLEKEHFNNGENVYWACDRTKDKKTIFVVDHYVPEFDQDAGSKNTFMYLSLFVEMGMKVVFLGDNFNNKEPYTSQLEQMGIEVLYGNYYMAHWKEWLKDNGKYINYAYLNRPHISKKYIDIVRQLSKAKIVYFGQDTQFLRLERQAAIENNDKLRQEAAESKKNEMNLFSKADVIYVVGSYEQKFLQDLLPGKIIRNIPVFVYEKDATYQSNDIEKTKGLLFVGGFAHQPNEDGVLWFYKEVYPKLISKIPDLEWFIAGSHPTDAVQKLNSDKIHVLGYISDKKLGELYKNCRIDIAPLRYGAGVKGKVVEAVYNQIPLVTTDIGAEGLSKAENAFLIANDADEFANVVINLYNDVNHMDELKHNCVTFINNYFTRSKAKEIVQNDFN